MSVRIMARVFEAAGFTPPQKFVLVSLADHANEYGESIYPSVERLEVYTALGERTVRRVLAQLRKLGVLKIVRKATRYRPTEYAIDLDRLTRSEALRPEARGATVAGLETPGVPERPNRGATVAPEPITEPPLESKREAQAPATPAEPAPKLSAHPAIQAYRDAALAYPAKSAQPTIVETVGDDPQALKLWGAIVKRYILNGWNPRNVANMLDFYKRKTIPTTGGPNDSQRPSSYAGRGRARTSGGEVGRKEATFTLPKNGAGANERGSAGVLPDDKRSALPPDTAPRKPA